MAQNIFAQGMDAFDRGYDRMQTMRQDRARTQAGRALASGDRAGAMQRFGEAGMTDDVRQVQEDQRLADHDQRRRATEDAAARLDFMERAATLIGQIPDDGTQTQRRAALEKLMPTFQQFVPDPAALESMRSTDLSDSSLRAFIGEVKKYQQIISNERGIFGVTPGGDVEALDRAPAKPIEMDPEKNYYVPEGSGGAAPDAPIATARPQTDAVFEALIQQESGGRPGVLGPQTQYGQAEGMTQMLPATAEEMARKVGVPWRPDLMRGDTPAAAEYQKRLGKAYFEEGLQKYGGDVEKALMYYHGGPNERLWGPKTRTYAQQVMRRAGGQETMRGGSGQDTVGGIPGYRQVQQGRPKQKDAPSGYRYKQDGSLEPIPGGPEDKSAKATPEMRAERAGKARAVIAAVDDALGKVGSITGPLGEYSGEAGFVGGMMSRVPGTQAYDVARQVETIKANLGFEELQRMRDNSPTGGALGQVAVQELVYLQATVANLDTGQSPAQLRANLRKIRQHYNNWLKAVGEQPVADAATSKGGGGKPGRPPLSSFQR